MDSGSKAHVAGSLEECLRSMGDFNPQFTKLCKAVWDGILCWPPTLPSMTIRQQCPELDGYGASGFAYKTCTLNCTWEAITNYTQCSAVQKTMTTFATTIDIQPFPKGHIEYSDDTDPPPIPRKRELILDPVNDEKVLSAVEIVEIVSNSLSIVSLLLAIFLFVCLVKNQTRRHKILAPLFATSSLRFGARILQLVIPFVVQNNAAICIVLSYIIHFSSLSTYSWMAVLGIYYLFAVLDDVIRKGGLFILYVVGLGIPLLFTTAWVLTVTNMFPDDLFNCQWSYIYHESRWIYDAPKLACVLITICLLTVCVYALYRSSSADLTTEMKFARLGTVKSTMFLMFLGAVDLYLLVGVYQTSIIRNRCLPAILNGIGGVVMSLFLCFLDVEIWHLRRRCVSDESLSETGKSNGKQTI